MPPEEENQSLRIRLLGGFSVAGGAGEVADRDWKLRKAKTLVKLLALAPGRRLDAEQAAELLWPNRSPDAARNNLHQALHAARRALDRAGGDGRRALWLGDGVLALCREQTPWIDAVAFTEAAARARSRRDVQDYRAALELYAGELLPENRHDDWSAARREALRELHLALGVELAELEATDGHAAVAIETLRSVLDEAPLYEPAHRALMRMLVRSGRRQEALAQFQELKRRLRREFADSPDEKTSQLYRQILTRSLGPEAEPPVSAPAPQPPQHARRRERELAGPGGIRVLIADDHPVFRDGLTTLLEPVAEITVVGHASTGREAVDRAVELEANVVVMDIQMPELSGIEATRELMAACPGIGVLMLTMFEDDDWVLAAMRAGARGYVLKGATQAKIVQAIRAVGSGEAIFGPASSGG